MHSLQKNKTILLILGLCLVIAVIVGYEAYRKSFTGSLNRLEPVSKNYLLVSELPGISATTTDTIKTSLEEAFAQRRLVVVSEYENKRNGDRVILAAPSFASGADSTGDCGLQENPYCGLFVVRANGETKLAVFGSKLAGFSKVERFVDENHVQFLTTWSLLNFTSTDRKQLNLENSEILPLLVTETDQDDRFASMNVSGHGEVLTLEMTGTSVSTRLSPERIQLVNPSKQMMFSLPEEEIDIIRLAFQQDEKRKTKSIEVVPSDEDVINNSLRIDLYGIPYKLDLRARILKRITNS